MRIVKDACGREWNISANVGALKRVKGGGYDLLDGEVYRKFFADPLAAADVAWGFVSDQAKAAGLNQKQFEDQTDGATLKALVDAIVAELADFFRPSKPELAAYLEQMAKILAEVKMAILSKPPLPAHQVASSSEASNTPTLTPLREQEAKIDSH